MRQTKAALTLRHQARVKTLILRKRVLREKMKKYHRFRAETRFSP